MDESGIYLAISVIGILTLGLLIFLQSKRTSQDPSPCNEVSGETTETTPVADVRNIATARPLIGGSRNRAAAARQRARTIAQREQHLDAAESSDEVSDLSDQEKTPGAPPVKIGKKKQARLLEKEEKKARRLEEERLRKEKKEEDERKYELRKEQEAKLEAEEKLKEEEEKLKREEQEKREQEEYEKMKLMFQVDEEGFDDNKNEEDEANLLQDFIDHIEKSKVVVLEELAALFKLKTQAAIDRIIQLQSNGRLTGVIDDRGKFISISSEELQNVAKFIKRRGRVSLTELAEASNKLIDLNPGTVVVQN